MTLTFGMSYIYPTVWSVYLCSLISGVGEATIWVAQGPELLENSTDDNVGLNSSIFWFMYQEKSFIRHCFRLSKIPEVIKMNTLEKDWSIRRQLLRLHVIKGCGLYF